MEKVVKFTQEIVADLNHELSAKGCSFRFQLQKEITDNPSIEIVLPSMNGIDSFILNITDEFFEWLQTWCKINYGIILSCNNTRSTMWSKNGWNVKPKYNNFKDLYKAYGIDNQTRTRDDLTETFV